MAQATNDIAEEYPELPAGLTPRQLANHIYVRAKICESCHKQKADNNSEFEAGSNVCRLCQDVIDHKNNLPVEKKALSRLLDAMDRGTLPNATSTVSSIMRNMGGDEGVGKKFRYVYDKSIGAEDWKVAARMLQTLISANLKVTQQQQDAAIETMNKEELREYLKELYSQHIKITLRDPLALPGPDDPEVLDA